MKRLIKKSFFGPDAVKLEDIEFIENNYSQYVGRLLVRLNEQGLTKEKEDPGDFEFGDDVEPGIIAFIEWEIDNLEERLEDTYNRELHEDYRGSQLLYIPLMEILPGYQQSMIFKHLLDKFNELVLMPFHNEYGEYLFLDADFANSKLQGFLERASGSLDIQWLKDHVDEVSE